MARRQLAGSPGLGMLQPQTKFISTDVEPHVAEIFLPVSYNWEVASATSASTSPVTNIWTPKNRGPGDKGLGATLKKNEFFVFQYPHSYLSFCQAFHTVLWVGGSQES